MINSIIALQATRRQDQIQRQCDRAEDRVRLLELQTTQSNAASDNVLTSLRLELSAAHEQHQV